MILLLPPRHCSVPVPRGNQKRIKPELADSRTKEREGPTSRCYKWKPTSSLFATAAPTLLTWSITGAAGRVQAGIVGRSSCRVGCGVTYRDTRKASGKGIGNNLSHKLGFRSLHRLFLTAYMNSFQTSREKSQNIATLFLKSNTCSIVFTVE